MVSNVLNPDWIVSESNNLLVLDSFKLKLKLYKLGVSGDHNLGFRLLISKVTVLYSPFFSMIFFIDYVSIKISFDPFSFIDVFKLNVFFNLLVFLSCISKLAPVKFGLI